MWLRSLGADLNFAEFYFEKMLRVGSGSCVGRESGGHVGILGLGERGVLGMELSSFMYPRARAHYARVCVRVRGGRLLKLIRVCSHAVQRSLACPTTGVSCVRGRDLLSPRRAVWTGG